jgi:hypothetical protein
MLEKKSVVVVLITDVIGSLKRFLLLTYLQKPQH